MEDEARRTTAYQKGMTVALAAYWIVLFIATHVPRFPRPFELRLSDKGLHSGSYTLLAFLLAAWWASRRKLTWPAAAGLFAIVAGYGAIDELLQIPVGRHCDILDWRADLLGAVTGIGAYALGAFTLSRLRKRHGAP